jgi:hypothetical protein
MDIGCGWQLHKVYCWLFDIYEEFACRGSDLVVGFHVFFSEIEKTTSPETGKWQMTEHVF